MVDKEKNTPIEEKIAAVDGWIGKFSETGKVDYIEEDILREALENYGADFSQGDKERQERLLSLSNFSNAAKGEGMRAVWGENMFGKEGQFNVWANTWAREYMERTGKKLPKLTQKSKTEKDVEGEPMVKVYYNSGLVAFMGDVTAYTAGRIGFGEMKTRLEARFSNGQTYQAEQQIKNIEKRYKKIIIIDEYVKDGKRFTEAKKIRPSSFPPEFPNAAWEHIKTWMG